MLEIQRFYPWIFLMFLTGVFALETKAQTPVFDIQKYDAEITPDLTAKSVKGKVSITFDSLVENLREITLNAGVLEIELVKENSKTLEFEKKDSFLKIRFASPLKKGEKREIKVAYHGSPKYGIQFFPEQNQVYTIFSTSQWMPCVDAPSDRAEFRLTLKINRKDVTAVGNGRLAKEKWSAKDNYYESVWEQKNPVPTYLFGFAAGRFQEVRDVHRQTIFHYLAPPEFSAAEIKKIFRDTGDMLDFYEAKSGVKYPYRNYTQVLAKGNAQQEVDGFSLLNEDYGRGVLADEKNIWLGAHELAHQWWGNQVTNRDWTHFWLNEGIANFMTAAYFEHRFGREKYLSEIERYKQSYEKAVSESGDKPLVFPAWNKPTRNDRRIVYDKGAYAIHLLRNELGEKLFWKGFQDYTQKYFGKSVETKGFQITMEKSSSRDLSEFFDKWIYLKSE